MNNFKTKDVWFVVGVLVLLYIIWKFVIAGLTLIIKLAIPIIIIGAIVFYFKYYRKKGNTF